jgi:signal transduction histidine kinase
MNKKSSRQELNSESSSKREALLYALISATDSLQKSVFSEQKVIATYKREMKKLKMRGGINLLDKDREHLITHAVAYTGKIMPALEKLTGMKAEGYRFKWEEVDAYKKLIKTKKAHFTERSRDVVAQLLPKKIRGLTQRILKAFPDTPAIFAPLLKEGQVIGGLNMVGKGLTQSDVPIISAFANHISIALNNSTLFNEIRKNEAKLKEYTDDLEQANQELIRHNRELDEFTYIASHDLQEPLNKLTAFADLLKRDLGDNPAELVKKDLSFILTSAERMRILVHDLLMLSQAGKSIMKLQRVSLDACVDKALEALDLKVKETRTEIKRDKLPTISGDLVLLTQVYQNLIGNAVKFRDQNVPKIHITTEKKKGEWILGVKDNGIGIKSDYFDKIFVAFQRLHSRNKYEGSGIGLSVCKKIVGRHGGRIWVESELGKGAHFKFSLKDN